MSDFNISQFNILFHIKRKIEKLTENSNIIEISYQNYLSTWGRINNLQTLEMNIDGKNIKDERYEIFLKKNQKY